MNAKLTKAFDTAKSFLESKLMIPILFDVMLILWLFNLTYVSVLVMAIAVGAILLLCKDVKNSFLPVVYISFFINDLEAEANFILYGIAIGIVAISAITFVVLKFVKERKTLKKGNMFWAFVIEAVAFLLAGCIGHFNLLHAAVALGFCLLTYFFYWVAINSCKNVKEYLFRLAVYGAIYIVVVFCVLNIGMGSLYDSIVKRRVIWVGAQQINVAATFIVFGIIGAFALGYKTKFDYLYFLLATFLYAFLLFTFCRLMIGIGTLAYIFLLVVLIVKSPKKKNFIWTLAAAVLTFGILCVASWDGLEYMIDTIVWKLKTGGNGREQLWPWCIERFLENPIFGYGFVSDTPVPTLRNNVVKLIMAHNTVLQWLTSLGIVGSVLMIYYYYKKYQIMFTRPLAEKFFLIVFLITIELNGLFDQTAIMSIFVVFLTNLLLAACEEETPNVKKCNLFKMRKTKQKES